ncbi:MULTISPECIES: SPOR domain-containing protein [unclassified Pseudoalteromonas]|uniref:SPOR domain-containing protein n=1 Tax=unclassified Pseudoalteromonas TaxID=194690 RepID=UPI000C07797E|nr:MULTISPECIES: SPOR domain-containing protein [unclassified Pseudoalteromonas]MDP2634980.1 SPOR domain-containing protein [Pseudoalteromonas sp. 1_MG-2023]PHN89571.1 DedD protein [Pseudoalteromonas sp. 3D05]
MNSGFINRLVGTSIVVIAAIIFIPNILDGEKVHYQEGFKAIPERPEFKTIDLQETIDDSFANAEQPKMQVVEDISNDDALLSDNKADKAPEVITAEPEFVTATTDSNGQVNTHSTPAINTQKQIEQAPEPVRQPEENLTKMAYVIQLGSFSHAANVKSLQAKLKANGFKTFTRPVKTPNGTLTKVFVGPSLDKAQLQSKLPELKELTKLNGKVTQFEVTK